MGKWASQRKRGSAQQIGQLSPPLLADWSFTAVGANTITVHRITAAPAPANGIWTRGKQSSSSLYGVPAWVATDNPFGGLVATTLYDFQIAWGTSTVQMSDWTPTRQQSTV